MSAETTAALVRAERALVEAWHGTIGRAFHPTRVKEARATVAAALNGPKDQYECMDDVTIAVHAAICEYSPEDCVEYRGACVKAVEAAREALLGGAS